MATTVDDVALLARGMVDALNEVEAAEAVLKRKSEHLRLLREETIPCVMEELGLTSIKLDTGETLSVKPEVYCSIPKEDEDKRLQAFQFLIDHDGASLIKTYVSVEFGKDEWKQAQRLQRALIKNKMVPIVEQTVHASTLKAYMKEIIAKATPGLDLSVFNARSVMVAKLKS